MENETKLDTTEAIKAWKEEFWKAVTAYVEMPLSYSDFEAEQLLCMARKMPCMNCGNQSSYHSWPKSGCLSEDGLVRLDTVWKAPT